MDREKIKAKILAAAKDGRLRCEEAFRVAGEAGVPPQEVGKLCDELKIKIKGCRLGCF